MRHSKTRMPWILIESADSLLLLKTCFPETAAYRVNETWRIAHRDARDLLACPKSNGDLFDPGDFEQFQYLKSGNNLGKMEY